MILVSFRGQTRKEKMSLKELCIDWLIKNSKDPLDNFGNIPSDLREILILKKISASFVEQRAKLNFIWRIKYMINKYIAGPILYSDGNLRITRLVPECSWLSITPIKDQHVIAWIIRDRDVLMLTYTFRPQSMCKFELFRGAGTNIMFKQGQPESNEWIKIHYIRHSIRENQIHIVVDHVEDRIKIVSESGKRSRGIHYIMSVVKKLRIA